MEIEILHNMQGDKRRVVDTNTEEGRKEAEALLRGMLRQGTAIFLERGKKVYRVTGFDAKKNRLRVRVEEKNKEVQAKPDKGRKTAVPPRAGG
jgi:hypothetical protein